MHGHFNILTGTAAVAMFFFAAIAALAADEPAGNVATRPVNWTPVIVDVAASPRKFQGSDDKYNLVYDVVLRNYFNHPSKIKEFAVFDADEPSVPLLKLQGKQLGDVFTNFTKNNETSLIAGETGVIWVNLSFDKSEHVPKKLVHHIALEGTSPSNEPTTYRYKSKTITVDSTPAVVISPPLRGEHWVVSGGYSGRMGHRRALFPVDDYLVASQTYAIDWLQLSDKMLGCTGDPKKNESFPSYGQPVYAVADGTIFGTVDKFQNQVPGSAVGSQRIYYPGGNSITLDLGNGYFAFYAHLKPGSLKVREGEKVKRGQIIALLGNAGNSDGPHLHMHITAGPEALGSRGVPYVFDRFKVEGELEDIDAFEKTFLEQKPQTVKKNSLVGEHKLELPKEGAVLSFP